MKYFFFNMFDDCVVCKLQICFYFFLWCRYRLQRGLEILDEKHNKEDERKKKKKRTREEETKKWNNKI